jgi:hypothetical protein
MGFKCILSTGTILQKWIGIQAFFQICLMLLRICESNVAKLIALHISLYSVRDWISLLFDKDSVINKS